MKLILFQLITNYTIGSLVGTTFDPKIFMIVDILYKPSIKRLFHFEVRMINEYGGFEHCGIKALKDIWDCDFKYHEINAYYRKFYLGK